MEGYKNMLSEKLRFGNEYVTLQRFLLSYLLILIIPISIGSVVYTEAIRTVEEDARNFNRSILQQTKDILDARFKEIDIVVKELSHNDRVISLMNMNRISSGSPDYFKVWDLMRYMMKYKLTNEFISEFFILYRNDLAISSGNAIPNFSYFYGKSFKYANMDYEQWEEMIWSRYHRNEYYSSENIFIYGRNYNAIKYLQSIPFDVEHYKGVIMLLIDEQALHRYLSKVIIGDDGFAFITNENGEIVTYISTKDQGVIPKEIHIYETGSRVYRSDSKKEMIVTSVSSSLNRWNYVSVTPTRYVFSRVRRIKNITLILMLCSLIIGVLLSFVLSYRNTKPIKNMVEMLKDIFDGYTFRKSNPYDYLQRSLSSLIQHNKKLNNDIKNQMPILKTTFLRRLLNGEFHDEKEIAAFMRNISIDLSGNYFAVVIIKIEGYRDLISQEVLSELAYGKAVLKNVLNEKVTQKFHIYDMDENKIALLVPFKVRDVDQSRRYLRQITEVIYAEMLETYKMKLFFAIGSIYDSIFKIGTSYEEARHVLDYRTYNHKGWVLAFDEIPRQSEKYYYPIELEMRLISNVKYGDKGAVKEILRKVYTENFENARLCADMAHQLVYVMKGTVMRIAGEIETNVELEEIMQSIDKADTIDEIFNLVVRILIRICDLVVEKKESKDEQFRQRLIEYIHKHYSFPEMSIYKIAMEFDVSEAFLYQFFKDHMGISFARYLEKIRIENACNLLSQSDIDVKDVSKAVGFFCDHTFRRVFKKIQGVNPTDYRNAVKRSI